MIILDYETERAAKRICAGDPVSNQTGPRTAPVREPFSAIPLAIRA